MKKTRSIINYSILSALTVVLSMPADAGVRVGNLTRSYAEGYQQVNAMREQYNQPVITATTESADTENNLPVRVANQELAEQVISGDTTAKVQMGQLEACSMIYPNGEFAWDKPTLGSGSGGASTCVAVVELRGYQMGQNGSDAVLARGNLAAGDSFKCNISSFPDASYTLEAGNVTFPHDDEPTREDVIAAMNQEQKQNAGLKIVAGAIIGGLGGNIAGKNDVGNDNLLGTDKGKIQGTAIGALSGAALMAGNAYAGKVGGDIILSTGVNAAAGSVIGNIAATGNSVLRIENCELEGRQTTCLWGVLVISKEISADNNIYFNIQDGETTFICDKNNQKCEEEELVSIVLEGYPDKSVEEAATEEYSKISIRYHLEKDDDQEPKMVTGTANAEDGIYVKVDSARIVDDKIEAIIPDVRDTAFGMTKDDWNNWKKSHSGAKVYRRSTTGQPYELDASLQENALNNFYPMMLDATDGGIIDLGNKARLKSTLTGAGVGGALGAFSAYQGAQSDIENRWVTAVREYKDSLGKFYCVTGNRYLGQYNDEVVIPNMQQ